MLGEGSTELPPWVSDLVGSRLAKVRALVFFLRNHVGRENLQFELENDRGAVWTVLSGLDGESINLRPGAIDGAETFFAENLGYSKIVDQSDPEIIAVLHKGIESATSFLLFDTVLIGFRLAMSGGASLEIFNAGDNLVLVVNQEHPLSRENTVSRTDYRR